jgi:hypothetical protein
MIRILKVWDSWQGSEGSCRKHLLQPLPPLWGWEARERGSKPEKSKEMWAAGGHRRKAEETHT